MPQRHHRYIPKQELPLLQNGSKTLELLRSDHTISAGDIFDLTASSGRSASVSMRVKRVTHYDNVEKALATEDIARLQPGKTVKEILAALHSRLATMGESKNNGDWKRRSVTVIELENSS